MAGTLGFVGFSGFRWRGHIGTRLEFRLVRVADPFVEQPGQNPHKTVGQLVNILESQLGFVQLSFSIDTFNNRVHMGFDSGRSGIAQSSTGNFLRI